MGCRPLRRRSPRPRVVDPSSKKSGEVESDRAHRRTHAVRDVRRDPGREVGSPRPPGRFETDYELDPVGRRPRLRRRHSRGTPCREGLCTATREGRGMSWRRGIAAVVLAASGMFVGGASGRHGPGAFAFGSCDRRLRVRGKRSDWRERTRPAAIGDVHMERARRRRIRLRRQVGDAKPRTRPRNARRAGRRGRHGQFCLLDRAPWTLLCKWRYARTGEDDRCAASRSPTRRTICGLALRAGSSRKTQRVSPRPIRSTDRQARRGRSALRPRPPPERDRREVALASLEVEARRHAQRPGRRGGRACVEAQQLLRGL